MSFRLKTRISRFALFIKNGAKRIDPTKSFVSLSENEKIAVSIFDSIVAREDAFLFVDPMRYSMYSEADGVFAIITDNELKIVNGKYQYELPIDPFTMSGMRDRFLKAIRKRRRKIDRLIMEKTKNSLCEVLKEVSVSKKDI